VARKTLETGAFRALELSYIPAFDGVRGLAILAVLLHNLSAMGTAPRLALTAAFEWGWVGVQLFFVLSGFLITRILLQMRQVPGALSAFMARRALRIMPLYYATLVVYFLIVPRLFEAPTIAASSSHQIWYWLYLSNWVEPLGIGAPGLNHLWSLAVEAQFYLGWPLIVLVLAERQFMRVCVVVVAISLACGLGLRLTASTSALAVYKFTVTRMSAPAIGGLAAFISRRGAWRRAFARYAGPIIGCLAAALVAIVAWRAGFSHEDAVVQTLGFPIVAALFATWLLVIVCDLSDLPIVGGVAISWPSAAFLRAIGRVSYGMYVFHYPLHWAVMKPLHARIIGAGGAGANARLAVYIVAASIVTYALAWLSWRFFERPILALKSRFQAGRPVPGM
jgi:peptidoglycan/LPS O-acetylase OafA/YrhL